MRYKIFMNQNTNKAKFRCVLHGSFRKHFGEIQRIHRLFTDAGIEVLEPSASEVIGICSLGAIFLSNRAVVSA